MHRQERTKESRLPLYVSCRMQAPAPFRRLRPPPSPAPPPGRATHRASLSRTLSTRNVRNSSTSRSLASELVMHEDMRCMVRARSLSAAALHQSSSPSTDPAPLPSPAVPHGYGPKMRPSTLEGGASGGREVDRMQTRQRRPAFPPPRVGEKRQPTTPTASSAPGTQHDGACAPSAVRSARPASSASPCI